jgi:triosephosphate isomerase
LIILEFTNIDVAAQNVHQSEAGAFTGENSRYVEK